MTSSCAAIDYYSGDKQDHLLNDYLNIKKKKMETTTTTTPNRIRSRDADADEESDIDNNTTTSTLTTTAISLHSSIRDEGCLNEAGSYCSCDDDIEKNSVSPLMSFDFNEIRNDDDESSTSDKNGNNNSFFSCSSSTSSYSSSASSYWSVYQYVDLRYTMISNLIFLLGSSCQTYTAIMDLISARKAAKAAQMDDGGDDYDYYYDDSDDYVNKPADDAYYVIYALGPFLCIINACIDIRWHAEYAPSLFSYFTSCCRTCWCWWRRQRPEDAESRPLLEQEVINNSNKYDDDDDGEDDYSTSTFQSTESSSSDEASYWGYIVAILFGTGAVFEFYSTFLDDYYEDQDDWDDDTYLIKVEKKRPWYACNYKIEFVGMHLYLLSGVVSLLVQRKSMAAGGNRHQPSCDCDVRRLLSCFKKNKCETDDCDSKSKAPSKKRSSLSSSTLNSSSSSSKLSSFLSEEAANRIAKLCMFVGTVLFVSGSLLDCTIAVLCDPQERHELNPNKRIDLDKVVLSTCGLISCLLWLTDAILYIIADFFMYSFHIEDSKARRFISDGFRIPSSSSSDIRYSESSTSSSSSLKQVESSSEQQQQPRRQRQEEDESSPQKTAETIPLLSDPHHNNAAATIEDDDNNNHASSHSNYFTL